jgi:hypothetical protein
MTRPKFSTHALRDITGGRALLVSPQPGMPGSAGCRAVVIHLGEIAQGGDQRSDSHVDRAISTLPDPTGWEGRPDLPWGHPDGHGYVSGSIKAVRAGRNGYYFRCTGALYDTLRDVFFDVRYRQPQTAHRAHYQAGRRCGCVTVARHQGVAQPGRVDAEAQLELLRQVLHYVALSSGTLDLDLITADLFGGQRVLAEFYLLRLETEGFVAHEDLEVLDALVLTGEGAATLFMLEATRPGLNTDTLSAQTLFEAAEAEEHDARMLSGVAAHRTALDIPRFSNRFV